MSYKTILVQLDAFAPSEELIASAAEMAQRFGASLIGFSACNVRPVLTAPEGLTIAAELFEQEREEIRQRIQAAETLFRKAASGVGHLEWRGYIGVPTSTLIEQARVADLILTRSPDPAASDHDRTIDIGQAVLEAGRPVLVAGAAGKSIGERVLVAWKNVREARRAVVDALPFLVAAKEVRVVTVASGDTLPVQAEVGDVVAMIERHGANSVKGEVIAADDGDGSPILDKARDMGADLIVSGGYGHSRFREWIFGGVTRTLLEDRSIAKLMSY